MKPSPPRTLASTLTAGCVTLVILLSTIGAGFAWWWKFRADARERALRAPAVLEAPVTPPPVLPSPSGPAPGAPPP